MARQHVESIGNFYLSCSTHLFNNFASKGIAHWWENTPDTPRGAAIFTYYDPEKTCLRLIPNAPKFFQAAMRSGLISHDMAFNLGDELLKTVGVLLKDYSGFFASELKNGPIGQSIRYASDPRARTMITAHQNLSPDDLYAALPWPCMPELHFKIRSFFPAGIQGNYIENASQDLLRAITIAIDIVTLGAGLNTNMDGLIARLKWMRKNRRAPLVIENEEDFKLKKIVMPCFASGFQGMTFGLFKALPPNLESFAVSQLSQFNESIGESLARAREKDGALALEQATSLTEYARAFIKLLPPVEHAVFVAGGEKVGFKLNRERNYLAGYHPLGGVEAVDALADPDSRILSVSGSSQHPEIYIKFPGDAEALSPAFALLRLSTKVGDLPSFAADDLRPLRRSELEGLYQELRRQIEDGRGAFAASKRLFMIETVLQHYDVGETVLNNSKSRQYTERALGKPNLGYHVAGKAAKKFEEDIRKLAPQRFLFEALSAHSIRVRWRPYREAVASQEGVTASRV